MLNLPAPTKVSAEQTIIENIIKGDLSLFEVLIRNYNSILYKIARSYGFNHQDAEDLMQDTHVAAYIALQQFQGRSSYKTWISRIMINKCLYKLKYGYFKIEIPTGQVPEPNHSAMYTRSNHSQTENTILNRELATALEISLQNIPLLYRTVFVLRELEGFSVAETAGLLDISAINVKVRLNRAKSLLQKQIEQFYAGADLYAFNLIYCDAIVQNVFKQIRVTKNNAGKGQ